jgi:His-Xaa-Ser system protein HxsD
MDHIDLMARTSHIALIGLGGRRLLLRGTLSGAQLNQMPPAENVPRQILIRFDDRIISLLAVKKASYKYINSFAVDFSLKDNEILCALTFTSSTTEEFALRLAEDFKKEALDQDLREQVKAETEQIRNLIFALAFSKAGIVGNEQVQRD